MRCTDLPILSVPCAPNFGGVAAVQMVGSDRVQSIVRAADGSITAIAVEAGATFRLMPGAKRIRFQHTRRQQAPNGDQYDWELTFQAPRDDTTRWLFDRRLRGRKFHIIYTDRNGTQRLLEFARNESEFTTGEDAEKNHYTFRFFGAGKYAPQLAESSQVVEAACNTLFSVEYWSGVGVEQQPPPPPPPAGDRTIEITIFGPGECVTPGPGLHFVQTGSTFQARFVAGPNARIEEILVSGNTQFFSNPADWTVTLPSVSIAFTTIRVIFRAI